MNAPNYYQLLGTVAHPELWPIWTIVGAASTLFPFLLMPVYVIFISRIALAWSLDRQVPEWLGAVSERLHAPSNAIFATLAIGVVFLLLWAFPILKWVGLGALAPSADPALDGKLNLAASAWFTILASVAQLDHARRQCAARAADPAGPRQGRAVHPLAALPRGGLARLHARPVLVRGHRADLQHDLRRRRCARLPEQLGGHRS